MRRADDSRAGPRGSLVGNYAVTEAHRRYILNGNGTQEDHDTDTEDDSQEDGWITF